MACIDARAMFKFIVESNKDVQWNEKHYGGRWNLCGILNDSWAVFFMHYGGTYKFEKLEF